jgi:hypothetical protein
MILYPFPVFSRKNFSKIARAADRETGRVPVLHALDRVEPRRPHEALTM